MPLTKLRVRGTSDLLKKKLWKGQSGASQGFSSFM